MNEKSGYSDEVFIELRIQLARIEAKLDDIPEIKESLKETALKKLLFLCLVLFHM